MATKRSPPDGVRIVATGGVRREVWLLAGAAVVLAVVLLLALGSPPPPAGSDRPRIAGAPPPARPAAPAMVGEREAVRMERLPPARDLPAAEPAAPPAVEATEETAPVDAEADPGETGGDPDADGDQPTGIALFPPPGTDPPKAGIVVPEDFALPPGYVRHYQVTDDGKDLPAILMFHPDYAPVGADGQPLPVPDDRVVPPHMAPAGLAIHMLEVPENQVPMVEVPEDGAQDDQP